MNLPRVEWKVLLVCFGIGSIIGLFVLWILGILPLLWHGMTTTPQVECRDRWTNMTVECPLGMAGSVPNLTSDQVRGLTDNMLIMPGVLDG